MTIIREHLLWNDVIENDGKVHREETVLGAFLASIAFLGAIAILYMIFH